MGFYTVDQVRHFYIATGLVTELENDSPAGSLVIKSNKLTHSPYEPVAWLEYVSPNGENGNIAVRSDLIPLNNIDYISSQAPKSRPLKRVKVSLIGLPVVGEDYAFRITFRGLGYGGDEVIYSKTIGSHRVTANDTAATIMASLNTMVALAFKSEPSKMIKSTVVGNDLIFEEVLQPFVLGKSVGRPVDFEISFLTISTDEVWGTATDTTATNSNKVKNGRTVADMEWFYMGERADQRREDTQWSFFKTQLLADPTKEYNLVDICYHYKGNNEDVQHSRKIITIAFTADSGITINVIKALVATNASATVAASQTIVSVAEPTAVTVAKDATPTLPSTVTLTLADETTKAVAVTWSAYSTAEAGEFILTGTYSLPAGVTGDKPVVTIKLTVTA